MLTTSLGSLVCFSENLFTEASSVAKFPKYDVISCSKISHSLVIAYKKVIEIKLCLESFFSFSFFFFFFFFLSYYILSCLLYFLFLLFFYCSYVHMSVQNFILFLSYALNLILGLISYYYWINKHYCCKFPNQY